jgi:protein phosphatase
MYLIDYITNRGKIREHNEDALLIDEEIVSNVTFNEVISKKFSKDRLCLVVADGMGGHRKGEVASEFVLDRLGEYIHKIYSKDDLLKYLKVINSKLGSFANKNPKFMGMGTVLAGILFIKDRYIVFNVGDCRVYEYSFGFANLITTDHSIVYKLYQNGEISFNQINSHPRKNVVTSALMADGSRELEEIFVKEFVLESNKKFLICSDGVWENITVQEIEQSFSDDETALSIFNMVMNTSANDNLSLIVVEMKDE